MTGVRIMHLSYERLVIFVAVLLAGAAAATAQEHARIALLIGNQSYDPSVGTLRNP